jgi:hypothetical protein
MRVTGALIDKWNDFRRAAAFSRRLFAASNVRNFGFLAVQRQRKLAFFVHKTGDRRQLRLSQVHLRPEAHHASEVFDFRIPDLGPGFQALHASLRGVGEGG